MVPASPSTYAGGGTRSSRAVSALVALAVTLLVVLALIRLGLVMPASEPSTALVTVSLLPGSSPQATRRAAAAKAKPAAARRVPAAAAARASTPIPPPVVPPPKPPWNVMYLSHDQMVAADIANLPSHKGERVAATDADSAGSGRGEDAGGAGGRGDGPGGVRLYNAEWYRRPSHAEMATYLQQTVAQPGWGEVACRTAPDYRVEDCREIGETPGSHLARAVREASWQFRVLPPRVNGKPMIGEWVRIHFDVTAGGNADAS